jgi:hypothetical protein
MLMHSVVEQGHGLPSRYKETLKRLTADGEVNVISVRIEIKNCVANSFCLSGWNLNVITNYSDHQERNHKDQVFY